MCDMVCHIKATIDSICLDIIVEWVRSTYFIIIKHIDT